MKKLSFKDCILIDCISFTVVTVLLATLSLAGTPTMSISLRELLELFFCTTLIATLMYFTSKLPLDSFVIATVVDFADVAVVILGVGGLVFHWFPWHWQYVLQVVLILTAVFLITWAVMIYQSRDTAKKINRILMEREKNEPYHRS